MEELLFNTLRLIPITIDHDLTDEDMVRAITLNENIKSAYGYTFKPTDLVKIAKSDTDVWAIISGAVPDVKAKPMYPDFPSQVMDMDEAVYRFHQLVHYFSTYGIEGLFGVEVKKGWVPAVEDTDKTKDDKTLLDLKVLDVIEKENTALFAVDAIAQRKQRMTADEKRLVKLCVSELSVEEIANLKITFKENLLDVFVAITDGQSREVAKATLVKLCQHTGDVLKCVRHYLGEHRFKISTSQKKLFVKILESFSAEDFKENIMRSNMKREEVITTLQYLDYNTFSRSASHKELVAKLRNKDLKSWYSDVKKAFKEDVKKAVMLLAKRPGEFLRKMNEALNNGLTRDDIIDALKPNANALSLPTLVRLNTFFFSNEADERFAKNKLDLGIIVKQLLFAYLTSLNTPIRGKKVYVEEGMFDFNQSTIEINDKSEMSGYVRSGFAYKIPEEAKIIRFFTYWNDKKRVDIDLHAKALFADGTTVHIGWNSDYKSAGMVMSGDLTHSNAAEYIDVDLDKCDAGFINLQIQDYTRYGFNKIETVLCGVLAVSEMGKDVKLYNPKNCFFSNDIHMKATDLQYGYIDLKNRVLRFIGKEGKINSMANSAEEMPISEFTLNSYLETLFAAQKVERVSDKNEADIVLRLDKGVDEEISLIDKNFFLEG